MHAPTHLVDRHPTVSPERLIAQLIPPPTFTDVSFDNYRPDPAEPTQAAAVESCRSFCAQAVARRAGKKKLFGKREVLPGVGLYLDGGFGVGKTHLLASAYYTLAGADAGPARVRDVRGADPVGRGVRLRRVHRTAGRLCRGVHRRVRTRRSGQHHAGVAVALPAGGARGVGGGDVQHAARAARRGPVRRPGFPARDPHAGTDFHDRADRGAGLPAPRAATRPGSADRRAGGRGGRAGAGRHARRLRCAVCASGDHAPVAISDPDRRVYGKFF